MLLISMTRSLIKLDNTVETKLEDINMTNHDDYTNVHDRTNTDNHKMMIMIIEMIIDRIY